MVRRWERNESQHVRNCVFRAQHTFNSSQNSAGQLVTMMSRNNRNSNQHPDPKLREQIHMICLSVNCLFNIYDEASKRSFYFYYTLIVKQAHWILRCVVPLLLQSELKKITMGDKDTLICKVGKMCHLNSKATLKEERSSSQNCHSIRPFTPLIFMCWENKIQGDSVILLL